MASTKKKVDRTAAIRAAAERVRAASQEEAAKESPYGRMSLAKRNIAATLDAGLPSGRRAVEVAPVRDIDPSTYVPQPTKKLPPIYGVTDAPSPRQATSAASGPSPAQSRADFVEQALQSAKRKKREASAAPRLPSGAKAGPAVEQAAAALVQPSKPKARPTPKPAPSPEPAKAPAKKATKQAAKKAAKPATPPPAKKAAAKKAPAKKAAAPAKKAPAKKAAPKPAAKKAAAPAPAKAAPALQAAPAAPPANAPAKAPRRLPRFGAGAWFGLGALANAAAGFYDSYTREKARKERKGK